MESIDFGVGFVVEISNKLWKNWVWTGKNQLRTLNVFTLGPMAQATIGPVKIKPGHLKNNLKNLTRKHHLTT